MLKTDFQKGLFTVLVGVAIWFCPMPDGLKPGAWHMFAIFVATIIGFILHPLPIGAIARPFSSPRASSRRASGDASPIKSWPPSRPAP